MVDVGGDDRPPCRNFSAHEFGGNVVGVGGQVGAERFACVLFDDFGVTRIAPYFVHLHALAQGNEFHFRRDDALPRIVHLRNVFTGFGATRAGNLVETQMGGFRVVGALFTVFAG